MIDRGIYTCLCGERRADFKRFFRRVLSERDHIDRSRSFLHFRWLPAVSYYLPQRHGASSTPYSRSRGRSCKCQERVTLILREKSGFHGSGCCDLGNSPNTMNTRTTVARLEPVLGRIELGKSTENGRSLPAGSHFHSHRFALIAEERTSRVMIET